MTKHDVIYVRVHLMTSPFLLKLSSSLSELTVAAEKDPTDAELILDCRYCLGWPAACSVLEHSGNSTLGNSVIFKFLCACAKPRVPTLRVMNVVRDHNTL